MSKTSFSFDVSGLESAVKKALAEHESRKRVAMKDVAAFIHKEARLRAPKDAGDLENSISAAVEENEGKVSATVYVATGSPAEQYAVPMHENVYNLGEGSLGKQAKAGVRVGDGYLTRAITENMKRIVEILKAKLRKR